MHHTQFDLFERIKDYLQKIAGIILIKVSISSIFSAESTDVTDDTARAFL
jgi:hypothetical protein